jgi:nucleotide-binding universal stress UspA family protein
VSTTIVVGVDASEDARRAVAWVASVSASLDARVVAVHAVGLLEHQRGDPAATHLAPQLASWTAALEQLAPERVERRLLQGDPVATIVRVADAEPADLVVVGTRGAGARSGVLLGSTSLQLAERCPCPLVIVPAPGAAE